MIAEISNGDYVKCEGGLKEKEHIEELLQSIAVILQTHRGSFYPNKNFGANISFAKSNEDALASARQALCELDGVFVKSAELDDENCNFTIIINNTKRQVKITK